MILKCSVFNCEDVRLFISCELFCNVENGGVLCGGVVYGGVRVCVCVRTCLYTRACVAV